MLDKAKLRLLEKLDGWNQLEFLNYNPDHKKQWLLAMARRRSEPRPNQKTHKLGAVLCFYTDPKNACYDPEFDKHIRKLRPDWFVSKFDIINQNKKRLLKMARRDELKPTGETHELGYVFWNYTNPKHACYDPEFDKKIRKLRPDWFVTPSDKANQKKQRIFNMAGKGKPRPNKDTHELGAVLCGYTNPKHACYDPEFDKKIRKLRPDWFVTPSDKANQKKQRFLAIARRGEPRPNQRTHELGIFLCHYTNPKNGSYDPKFDKQIRKLRPDWFVSQSDMVNQKKKKLLGMARNGKPRPAQRTHELGRVLSSYTSPKSEVYDPKFDKQIRKLRPDWFQAC